MTSKPQRGKTTAASNAGSFAHKQHGEPGAEAALAGEAGGAGLAAARAAGIALVTNDLDIAVINTRGTNDRDSSGRTDTVVGANVAVHGSVTGRVTVFTNTRTGARATFEIIEHTPSTPGGAPGSAPEPGAGGPAAPVNGLAMRMTISRPDLALAGGGAAASAGGVGDPEETVVLDSWRDRDGHLHAELLDPRSETAVAVPAWTIPGLHAQAVEAVGNVPTPSSLTLSLNEPRGGAHRYADVLALPQVQAIVQARPSDDPGDPLGGWTERSRGPVHRGF